MLNPIVARYSRIQRHLHWWMALLVVLAYVLIEQRGLFPRGSGGRFAMMQGHFWAGITIFLLAWWRIASRLRHGAPPITPPLDTISALLSKLTHLALYAFFIVMPLLGMATAWSDGKAVMIPFTGIALPALLPENEALAHQLEDLHGSIGEAFYWVIGLHVLAALYHHWVRRDDTLKRML
ncbi:cytochrome b [Thermomonas hydrothermalis]|uniref:Cytochrome b561 n=1 Tax=Thermomonas hydrothermalis TaxID=213588 RepID=A0A1M4V7U2_9GAMM|nr:cytochrome b [Thermomonas hydrothermalis]MCL6620161.1 cytochrome b [Thermomonas hydrothermalis]SHE65029.1 cytochrome b561 [Thermomonas hydrothermalis]